MQLKTFLQNRRFFRPEDLDHALKLIKKEEIVGYRSLPPGRSCEGRKIRSFKLGTGKTKILAWSQMHGNETSSTRAILKLLEKWASGDDDLLNRVTICVIPMLNPDGAERFTRQNANDKDLNRDALDRSQPETKYFFSVLEGFEPDFCFNLHGQRSIFGLEGTGEACQFSFLAPAFDEDKSINSIREAAMQVIGEVATALRPVCKGIGRYRDDFNLNCFGDYLMHRGIPTILFESGHAGHDYLRNESVAITLKAISNAIYFVSRNAEKNSVNTYLKIPLVVKNHADIAVKFSKDRINAQMRFFRFRESVKNSRLSLAITQIEDEKIEQAHATIFMNNCEKNIDTFELIDYQWLKGELTKILPSNVLPYLELS